MKMVDIITPLPWEKRSKSIFPMPGSVTGYLDCLHKTCSWVKEQKLSAKELAGKLEEENTKAAIDYTTDCVNFLMRAKLIQKDEDGFLQLPELMSAWVSNKDHKIPIWIIHCNIRFIGELLEELREAKTIIKLHEIAVTKYEFDWKRVYPVVRRCWWLFSAGMIVPMDGRNRIGNNTKMTLTTTGDKFLKLLEEWTTERQDPERVESLKRACGVEAKSNVPYFPYTIDTILAEGCFLGRVDLQRLLQRLKMKKNLILQGPPGTGKTWLAKRLAYALIKEKNRNRVRAVQFHPNLSYEDFVCGWRPNRAGNLELTDGVFMRAIKTAVDNPSDKYVVVIEEINRGNPAQIFGELITLLEADKRKPEEAIEIAYTDESDDANRVYVPDNLYVIGSMNIADRSLALVDLALRRRFAFATLEPKLNKQWHDWVISERNADESLVDNIRGRVSELNDSIEKDLGEQYRIGHSYVTPSAPLEPNGTKMWFEQVVKTEIGPLLEEYWFDSPERAREECRKLLQDW